ncbi:hypothetical protein CYY_001078 [Polysphondylium violaceum]|uniref:Blue (type 1) copper domain-containing protein n=1 Tax=Polysphondylium violaceum TaxID=133409 RepID=A0A8J4Q1N2_9MYCE|nr:hypothetical protein CYY_001078 [Polysphondylium violaceum]
MRFSKLLIAVIMGCMMACVFSTEYTIPWSGPDVPRDKTIQVGDTLIFQPNDGLNHTVTSTDTPMLFDSGEIGNPSHPTFVYVFNTAGTYHFFCKIHGDNAFVLTVVDDSPATSSETATTAPTTSTETTAPTTTSTETTAPTGSHSAASHAGSSSPSTPTKAPTNSSAESITQPPKSTVAPPAAEEHKSSEHSSAAFTKLNPILLVAFIVLSVFMF